MWSAWYANGQLAWRGALGSMESGLLYGQVQWGPFRPPTAGQEGVWELWWDDGTPRRVAHYWSGVLEGSVEEWRPDGSLYERGEYVQGHREGVHEIWHRTGQRALVEQYANRKLTGSWQRFYPDGKPRERGEYVDGEKNGLWTTWHPNGRKDSEGRFENGKRVGEWRTFHANGAPELLEHYAAGVLDGDVRGWHFEGVERQHDTYEEGRRVRSRRIDETYDPFSPGGDTASMSDILRSGEREIRGRDLSCSEGARAVERLSIGGWTSRGCLDELRREQGAWSGEYRGGRKRFEHVYRDGQPDGPIRDWWENGGRCLEAIFERGVPHGAFQQWGWFGAPSVAGRFEHGVPVGIWRTWGEEFGLRTEEIELDATGELVRWQRWQPWGALIETGERVASGSYRVRRFDPSSGYPVLEIEAPAARYEAQAELPSGLVVRRPDVQVKQTGLATERGERGAVVGVGRYEDGRRVGDWIFPLTGDQRSFPSAAPAARQ